MSTFMVRNFLKYSVIFSEGAKGDSAYLLKEGRVEISKQADGKKKVFAILRPVSVFGEMALLLGDEDDKRTATAVALEDSKVVEIKRYDFEEYLKQSPPVISSILNVLVHRLKTANQKALRVPNLFSGVCNIFDLFGRHGKLDLNYLDTLNSLCLSFNVNKQNVENVFGILQGDGLISVKVGEDNEKRIHLEETKDFLAKAVKRRKETR
ncbi:MAG: cyclic nucleotide-binding domain-containing protein [Thermodesulfobacteriota bacterium]|nr:cyclic nucleotide-binding domain-containing protein [Thermodesulfobacteriota bacterium]